jgi:AcrR family transcriptional regulator
MKNMADLRVIKTLENIKNGFSKCIKEKTFTSITVKDIITAAKVNRSTFYKYYEDKYHLRESLVHLTLEELANDINLEAFKLDNHSFNILVKQLEFMHDHKDWYLLLWNKNIELYIYDDMLQIFEKKIEECLIDYFDDITDAEKDLSEKKKLFARLFASSAMTTVKWWYECSPNMSVKEIANIIMDNIKFGMHHAFCKSSHTINR